MEGEMKDKRKWIKNTFLTLFLLLIVSLMVVLPFLLKNQVNDTDGKKLLRDTVEKNSISITVSGSGILAEEAALEITMPEEVVITGYLVSNGDLVAENQPIAEVDTISVYQAASKLYDTLTEIESDLAKIQKTAVSTAITCNVPGVITAIYAEEGDDIRQVMVEFGALAEITMDNGTVIKVSGTSGTISSCPLHIGSNVFIGAVLFQIIDVDATSEYGALVLQHQKYEAMMEQLFQMFRDGYVVAPGDGMVNGVDKSLVKRTFTADHPEPSPSITISEDTAPQGRNGMNPRSGDGMPDFDRDGTMPFPESGSMPDSSSAFPGKDFPSTAEPASVSGNSSDVFTLTSLAHVVSTSSKEAGTAACYLSGMISGPVTDGTADFQIVSIKYANSDFQVSPVSVGDVVKLDFSDYPNAEKGCQAAVICTMDFELAYRDNSLVPYPIEGSETYEVLFVYEKSSSGSGNGTGQGERGENSGISSSGMSSGATGGSASGASGGGSTGTSSATARTYTLKTVTVASIVPTDNMVISITVDELDILSINKGDQAKVTIDALPGRSFDGVVTGVNTGNSNNGGNSKYLAEITIPRDDDFLAGMNASGLITFQTYSDVLTIPSAALCDLNGRTVVYTAGDESAMSLAGPVEVEIGVSDGELVQIRSGLSEGDVIWYIWYESNEIKNLSNSDSGNFFSGLFSRGGRTRR